jgi:tetratricopeptide (TPR) repeat protein/DNA-binding CsgD family transcriptional regulator
MLYLCQSTFASVEKLFPVDPREDTTSVVFALATVKRFFDNINVFAHSDSILIYLNNALEHTKNQSNLYYTYKIYNYYGELFYKNGNYYTAIDYYFKMMNMLDEKKETKENLDMKNEYAILFRNIGMVMTFIDIEKALSYFKKSLCKIEEINAVDSTYRNIDELRLLIYNNIGAAWSDAGRFDSAAFYCRKALAYPVTIENPSYYASLYNNLGIIYWELGERDNAFKFYDRSLAIREQAGDKFGMAGVHYNLGLCRLYQKNYKKTLTELNTAFDLSKESGNLRIEMFAVETLSKIYEQQNNFHQSLQMLQLSSVLKDSIAAMNRANEISRIELQYLFEKQLKENELNSKFLFLKKERRLLLTTFTSLLSLLLATVLFLLYRNLRIKNKKNLLEQQSLLLQNENLELKNKQLNKSINIKNKELNTQKMYLVNKNRFISSIIENAPQPNEQKTEQELPPPQDLKANSEESLWNKYNGMFQYLHQDFYNNLYRKHPNLTPNEKKLSAFIRLNMSTKEISAVTLQSTKSIEIARSRLRKKLKLQRDVNLNVYFQDF